MMSDKHYKSWYFVFLVLLVFTHVSCAPRTRTSTRTQAIQNDVLTTANYSNMVLAHKGYAMVLFYNGQFWQSQDMEKRFDHFSQKYKRNLKPFKLHWNVNDDGSKYQLELLPTLVLYHNGIELDRIKGIPESEKERGGWDKDINLWILKNVVQAKGNEFSGDYTYLFKNSSRLQISNF